MTDYRADLQNDLVDLAESIADLGNTEETLDDLSERVARLLVHRDLPEPTIPVDDIIDALRRGDTVEFLGTNGWSPSWRRLSYWQQIQDTAALAPGTLCVTRYRIVPKLGPATERVPLHQVIGRRLPGCDWDIDGVDFDAEAATFVGLRRDDGRAPSEQAAIDPDGTVEVLVRP